MKRHGKEIEDKTYREKWTSRKAAVQKTTGRKE